MRRNKIVNIILLLFMLLALSSCGAEEEEVLTPVFLASDIPTLSLIDDKGQSTIFYRGTEVLLSDKTGNFNDQELPLVYYEEKPYYVKEDQVVLNKEDCIKEKELWVYRTCTTYKDDSSSKIAGMINKGEKIEVIGSSTIKEDGTVDRYKYDGGYILAKYLTPDSGYSDFLDQLEYIRYLKQKTNNDYGAGSIGELDYYPNEKVDFKDNIMPDICRTLYINAEALENIDEYISLAKETKVNAFVIDIKDTNVITVKADTMKEYSPSSYENGMYLKEDFTNIIKKIKDNGIYTIARITVFKDHYFAIDQQEYAILDKNDNNKPFYYGGSSWPSAYCRGVWEYNVELSKEAVVDFGFNEIQFDYVRFPEQIDYFVDVLDALDLRNEYKESRASAIQRFLMYATDEIHSVHGYVSADVFGETANDYVCAYGQYLPAISNVVDVVSPMPYPDHFNIHDYGIASAVWESPYELLSIWGKDVVKQQSLIYEPAKIRCYIQGYDSLKEPYVVYDSNKIGLQIQGLIDAGIYDGYIIWNAASNIVKYQSYKDALSNY